MTITDLRNEISDCPVATLAYHRKQFHCVPDAPSVIREIFLLERCKGKVVLDIGASGKMHEAIVEVAAKCHGIDRPGLSDVTGVVGLDLDDYHGELPEFPDVEVVVCGEVIEHLSNPGWFLDRLRKAYHGVPVIITTPNAFSDGGRRIMECGSECINRDHIAYHSYYTLRTLVERAGYRIEEHCWYKGRPRFAEGIIFVVR